MTLARHDCIPTLAREKIGCTVVLGIKESLLKKLMEKRFVSNLYAP